MNERHLNPLSNWRGRLFTVIVAGTALIAATVAPVQHTSAKGADEVAIKADTDGISTVFSTESARDVLTFSVRVVGPGNFVFEERVQGSSLEWIPPDNLADGLYNWEAWVVTADPGAPMRELNPALEKRSPDHWFDPEFKQTHLASGSLRVEHNAIQVLETPPGREHKLSRTRRVASAILDFLVPSAHAQEASFATDTFAILDDSGNDVSTLTMTNDTEPSAHFMNQSGDMLFFIGGGLGDDWMVLQKDTGRLGIGKGPARKLDVDGATAINSFLHIRNNSEGSANTRINLNGSDSDAADANTWRIVNRADTNNFQIREFNTPRLTIQQGGNVGIGVSNPSFALEVIGTIRSTNRVRTSFGTTSDPTYRFGSSENTGLSSPATETLSIITSGEERIRISSSGNAGFGTTAPVAPLHIQRADNSARIRVQDTGDANQEMFSLRNNGAPIFDMEDTSQADVKWEFAVAGTQEANERFQISKVASGQVEMSVFHDGSAEFAGPVTADGVMLTSSRQAKTNFQTVDEGEILDKLASLEILQWRYKREAEDARHIGPTAEAFHEVFELSDGKHLDLIDTNGIAFAAIKALNAENQALANKNQELMERLARLEDIVINK